MKDVVIRSGSRTAIGNFGGGMGMSMIIER